MVNDYQEIIYKNETYFTALLADIHSAKYTIDIEVYIFENDRAGNMLAEALCAAAKRGVKIRVLVDGFGTQIWGNELTKKMENVGILTRVYHPLPWIFKHWPYANHLAKPFFAKLFFLLSKINSRNHRKVTIIDQNIIYIGSANITDHLLNTDDKQNIWRETSIKLIGAKTDELQYAFEKAWGSIPFDKRIRNVFSKLKKNSIYVLNDTWRRRHRAYKTMLNKIARAQNRIWVTNSYFVPDNALLKELSKAGKRGIDVRILLPSKSDVIISSLAAKTFYSTLLKNNILIYEYLPTMMHAKIFIADNSYSLGSSNLNYRSKRLDLEVDVTVQKNKSKEILEQQFLMDLKQSQQIQIHDINNQSLYKYIIGRIILFMRNWL